IAAALSLAPSDMGEGRPARWSAGLPFTFVPIASLAAMARCRPDLAKFDAAFGAGGAAYVFCNETAESGHHFHARMFAPAMGVPEDPATGSAAAAFAGVLARRLSDGVHALTIEQGYEMGRPSLIRLTAEVAGGRLVSASIGGDAVIVTEGTIEAGELRSPMGWADEAEGGQRRAPRQVCPGGPNARACAVPTLGTETHRTILLRWRPRNAPHRSAWARRVPRLCPPYVARPRHRRGCNRRRSRSGAGAGLGRQALQSIGMDEGPLQRGR